MNKGKRFKTKNSERTTKKHNIDKNTKNKKGNRFILFLILIVCLGVIGFSIFHIVSWFMENNKSNQMLSEVKNTIHIQEKPVTINNKPYQKRIYDFTDVLKKNPRTVGWIYVPNTNIDYSIVQSKDNDYYLNHSFDNSINSAGWIFGDYTNKFDNTDLNTVIYGHNRKDESMFGSLKKVLENDFKSNPNNLYISHATLTESHVYQIFSAFICSDSEVLNYTKTKFNGSSFNSYVDMLKSKSYQNFDVDVSDAQKIVTLYTCSGSNKRLIVCAKLVE